MHIVITGSLGNISKPLAALLAPQHHVTVISSSPDKQADIGALGATAAIGSLEDVAFLTSTFTGADAVYCMVPPNAKEFFSQEFYIRIGNAYKTAIEQSGVQRVVVLSSWGAHLDSGTGVIMGAYHVEQILNTLQGAAITYLRPCSFYYNLLNYIPMIKQAGIMGTNFRPDDKIAWVHPTDIAAAAAQALTTQGPAVQYVASDEATPSEVARMIGAAIGKPALQWVSFTDEQVKQKFLEHGLPERLAQDLTDLNASISSGRMGADYELHKPTLGKVKLANYVQEFAQAYHYE